MAQLKSYPVNLLPDPELPKSLFDPRWAEPRIAAKVALEVYKRTRFKSTSFAPLPLVAPAALAVHPRAKVEERVFPLVHVGELAGYKTSFKGGAFGEIHRRYSFGGGQPPVNFHAQAVAFGADEDGRWMLVARVGRWDGPWGNEAALQVRFFAGDRPLGGAEWRRTMDPAEDVDVEVIGVDPGLKASFSELDRAVVSFYAHHHGEGGGPEREGGDRGILDDALDVFGAKDR